MRKYENYVSALRVLVTAIDQDLNNEFVQSGVIDKFSLQFELGWKLLKALLAYEGESAANTGSPRDVIKAANSCYGFMDEETWLSMLRDRNSAAHVYDANAARELVSKVIDRYIPEFVRLDTGLFEKYGNLLTSPDM